MPALLHRGGDGGDDASEGGILFRAAGVDSRTSCCDPSSGQSSSLLTSTCAPSLHRARNPSKELHAVHGSGVVYVFIKGAGPNTTCPSRDVRNALGGSLAMRTET